MNRGERWEMRHWESTKDHISAKAAITNLLAHIDKQDKRMEDLEHMIEALQEVITTQAREFETLKAAFIKERAQILRWQTDWPGDKIEQEARKQLAQELPDVDWQ